MIKKEIVDKIILESEAKKFGQNITDIKDVCIEKLKWPDERIALRNFIANLPDEEFVDLMALMDYGRDHYNMRDMNTNRMEFFQKRKNVESQIRAIEDKNYMASHWLKKNFLSQYLRYALPLLESEDFKL